MIMKKTYQQPVANITALETIAIMAGSTKATIEGDPDPLTPDPDPTPGDASGGLSRRRSVWDDPDMIEEEQF